MDNEDKAFKYFSIICRTMYHTHCDKQEDVEHICGTVIGLMLLDDCSPSDIEEVSMRVLSNWKDILNDMKMVAD